MNAKELELFFCAGHASTSRVVRLGWGLGRVLGH